MTAPAPEIEDDSESAAHRVAASLKWLAKASRWRAENDSVLERWHAGDLLDIPKTPDAMRALAEKLMRAARDRVPLVADNDNDPGAPLPVINASEWAHIEPPEREWFIEGLIPAGTVTLLSGDGGVGKSLLGLQIAVAAAAGVETLGLAPSPGGALYIGAEDSEDEFHRRVDDVSRALGIKVADLEDLEIVPLADRDALLSVAQTGGNMVPTALWGKVRDRALEFGPCLVVLDTTADLFGGDEIKRAQARQFIAMLRKLAIETGAAVLLLSHPSVSGMQSGTGTSGSTGWSNSVRSRLYLTRPEGKDVDPDTRVLKTMKANYGTVGDEINLRWKAGAFVLDEGLPPHEIGFMNKRHDEVFLAVLRKFADQGVNASANTGPTYAPSKIAGQPEAKGISRKHLADAMQRLLDGGQIRMVTEGPVSRQRSRLVITGPSN